MKKSSSERHGLPVIHERAAGIDIGSRFHVVAVPADITEEPVQTFKAFTADVERMANWLVDLGMPAQFLGAKPTLTMHSGSSAYMPVAYCVPVPTLIGRLPRYAVLYACGSATLNYAAAHIQHMQKALTHMNLQLHHVVADITGATGMRIIRAIVAGERSAATLATMRDTRCKSSVETVQSALVGNYQTEHVLALAQALAMYDADQAQLEICNQQIAQTLLCLSQQKSPPSKPLPKPRHRTRQPNTLNFDVRTLLYQLVGVDLAQIHGIGPYLALRLVAECGTDLSRWRTAHHFTSWLTLAPGCRISGGKVLSAHTRKTKNRVTAHLRLAAVTIGKTNTALGAFYRRLSARIGKAKAVTATARKIAILFYNAMRFGTAYQDPGADHYEQKYRERVVKGLHRRAAEFGFTLQAVEGVS
ncbi:transposase [Stutzerimonas chloritidismutans]|uniref:transposase n=1 Tax=Stutzerimonas chloritidismutans TaxID=203192 RepID=UPI003AF61F84